MTAALLSIDPNYASGTGMALWLRDEHGDWQVVDTYTCPPAKGEDDVRLVAMMDRVAERSQQWQKIHHCRITYVAVESTFQGDNPKVSANLNQLLGKIRWHYWDFVEMFRDYKTATIDTRCNLTYQPDDRKLATATAARWITAGEMDLDEHQADAVCVGFAALQDIDRRVEA